jgi:molybdate transport system substrate-binding protein
MQRQQGLICTGIIILLLVIMALAGCGGSPAATTSTTAPAQHIELNVSAAASLTDALTEVNKLYMQLHENVTIVTNFGSSGTLQKQIEQGAPVDVFLSAGAKQVQALQDEGLLLDGTRANLFTNRLVLVVPKNSALTLTSFTDLTNDNIKQIAIGDPESVPAGTYGKQAFDQLGIYDLVQPKLILCSDVKQVLSYVEAGNVDAGIVYATDAALSSSVKITADAPAEVNAKIVYPGAVIKAGKNAETARAYMQFLISSEAKAVFEKYGFIVVQK